MAVYGYPRSSLVQQAFEKGALQSVSQQRPTGKHEDDTLSFQAGRPSRGSSAAAVLSLWSAHAHSL
jgi:hypothetical protein